VTTKYLTFEGYTFKSGDAPRTKAIASSKEIKDSFTLSPERIIYNWVVDDFRTHRVEFKGNFQYSKQGELISGTVSEITLGTKFTGTTEGSGEDILSYKISKAFSDISNYSYFNSSGKLLDFPAISDSLSYLYKSSVRWTGFSGQAPSLTSEAGYRP
jgi:hypothetical protein